MRKFEKEIKQIAASHGCRLYGYADLQGITTGELADFHRGISFFINFTAVTTAVSAPRPVRWDKRCFENRAAIKSWVFSRKRRVNSLPWIFSQPSKVPCCQFLMGKAKTLSCHDNVGRTVNRQTQRGFLNTLLEFIQDLFTDLNQSEFYIWNPPQNPAINCV